MQHKQLEKENSYSNDELSQSGHTPAPEFFRLFVFNPKASNLHQNEADFHKE